MSGWAVLAVALGGMVGAPARYVTDRVLRSEMPVDTLLVNVAGSVALGVLTGLQLHHHAGPVVVALVGTGFCGAFTTFSSFVFETLQLLEEHSWRHAAVNVATSLTAGLAGAAIGFVIGLHLT